MDSSLLGEYDCKLDAKGRMRIPSQLLKQLAIFQSNHYVVNRGYEKHLMLYPRIVWEQKTKEINQLNINVKDQRSAIRYFNRGASEITIDGSERILLPNNLLTWAGIEREVVLFAYRQQIEVWEKSAYYKMLDEEPESFGEIAEKIWGNSQLITNSPSEEQ